MDRQDKCQIWSFQISKFRIKQNKNVFELILEFGVSNRCEFRKGVRIAVSFFAFFFVFESKG